MNTRYKIAPYWLALAIIVLAALACKPGVSVEVTPSPAPEALASPSPQATEVTGLSQQERFDLMLSTVQIAGLYLIDGELIIGYTGSGTIISKDGLILTNAHVASPPEAGEPYKAPDALGIAIVTSEDKPADPAYFAEVKVIDGYLDLAVLQITETLDGNNVDPGKLNLPYVELGDSEGTHIGDHLNVFGFPGIGGDTITYTQGTISGFASDDEIGDRSWVKTDATISGGNSGGLGADDKGFLIGIPTGIGAGKGVSASDCRPSQDTNGDNSVDGNDFCVPISNFISELRPINLAKPLIQAAKGNMAYESPYASMQSTEDGTGDEAFGPVAWYSVTNIAQCEPGEKVDSFPSGTKAIAAVYDYSGMTVGQAWAVMWNLDGEKVFDSQYSWDGDQNGTYASCLNNGSDPLPDGTFQIQLFAGPGGLPLLSKGEVVVGTGAAATQPPAKGEIRLSGEVYDEATNNLIAGAVVVVLKTGITYDAWDGGESGVFTLAVTDSKGYYVLPDKLLRNTPYTVVSGAEGYYDTSGVLIWDDKASANYTLDIGLTK